MIASNGGLDYDDGQSLETLLTASAPVRLADFWSLQPDDFGREGAGITNTARRLNAVSSLPAARSGHSPKPRKR